MENGDYKTVPKRPVPTSNNVICKSKNMNFGTTGLKEFWSRFPFISNKLNPRNTGLRKCIKMPPSQSKIMRITIQKHNRFARFHWAKWVMRSFCAYITQIKPFENGDYEIVSKYMVSNPNIAICNSKQHKISVKLSEMDYEIVFDAYHTNQTLRKRRLWKCSKTPRYQPLIMRTTRQKTMKFDEAFFNVYHTNQTPTCWKK